MLVVRGAWLQFVIVLLKEETRRKRSVQVSLSLSLSLSPPLLSLLSSETKEISGETKEISGGKKRNPQSS